MPPILRSRLALFALLGAFLIPIAMSSLRGLTHVLSCKEEARQPFTVIVNPVGDPEVLSSMRISKGSTGQLCGGLTLEPQARTAGQGKLILILPIQNHTEHLWRGTVTLRIGKTEIPVDIGQVPAGETGTDEVELDLEPGTLEVNGALLIGP
jgi:hypothetical protein